MRTLYGKKWYTPREIAKLGLIKNSVDSEIENSNYYFVIKLIRTQTIAAKNFGLATEPRWLVPEEEIERYNKSMGEL